MYFVEKALNITSLCADDVQSILSNICVCYVYASQEMYAYDEYFNRTTFGVLEGTITRTQLIVLLRKRVRFTSIYSTLLLV